MHNDTTPLSDFNSFGLSSNLHMAIRDLGYTTPTAIQARAIAPLMGGRDILGQAQTGTGKTAAFALPMLNYLDPSKREPQVLVLTPTRELAIQVTEAFQQFARHMTGINILAIYGGAEMRPQLRQLSRGVHVVVGTPGRVMDHMRRGSLTLSGLTSIVLDEADEMLNMGFQESVEWILEQAPKRRQMALFSATIPAAIRQIAMRFMNDPEQITIQTKTTTAATIEQRYWLIRGLHKLDALSRILEGETTDGVLVFVRTRAATSELAARLAQRGFRASALSGEMAQNQREQTVDRFKRGQLDILVATDVAARGLDLDRISHVINYDAPGDAEAYTHRIGRTGRAGRKGVAILFISSRERTLLRQIEKTTRQTIEPFEIPTVHTLNEQRVTEFKQRIVAELAGADLDFFRQTVREIQKENDISPLDIAAAAARLAQGTRSLLLDEKAAHGRERAVTSDNDNRSNTRRNGTQKSGPARSNRRQEQLDRDLYRVEVGHADGVKPGNLVGAIAEHAGLEGKHIGKITIEQSFSTVDLPAGMPPEVLHDLQTVWVGGKQLKMSRHDGPVGRGSKKGFSSRKRKMPSGVRRQPMK